MATDFQYEHVFRAPSVAAVLAAYFDPEHLAMQDKLAELGDRTVTEDEDTEATRKTSWRVHSLKPLPVFARPFVQGGRLTYVETMTLRKAANEIDLTIAPQILSGRVSVTAVYALEQIGEGQVRRRYRGQIVVGIPLLSGKIERAIIAEIDKGMPLMTGVTQTWLDQRAPRS